MPKKHDADLFRPCLFDPSTKYIRSNRAVYLYTLPRSGSHFTVNWIGSQYAGKVRFVSGINMGDHRRNDTTAFDSIATKMPDLDYSIKAGAFTALASFELCDPAAHHTLPWLCAEQTHRIILLRDPFNWAASCLKAGFVNLTRQRMADIWMAYAREYLDADKNGLIAINYNKLVADPAYRDQLAQTLGLDQRSDAALKSVPRAGHGSSFTGTDLNGHGQTMPVLERWKTAIGNPDYAAMFRDNPDLVALSDRIFGPIPGIAQFIDDTKS